MKQIIKRTWIAAVLVGAVSGSVSAQELRTSYFMKSSTFRHQMNPALLDQSYMGVPLFGNINVGATGNLGLKNLVYKLDGNPDYDLTTFMSPTVDADQFLSKLRSKNKGNVSVNYNISSVAFAGFGGINLVELNARSNTSFSIPYELLDFMKRAGEKETYTIENLGARTQNFAELVFGHSRIIDEKLTVGAKVKLLFGFAYADFNVKKMNLTLNEDQWIIDADAELTAAILQSDFKTKDPQDDPYHHKTKEGERKVDGLDDVSGGMPGFGMALDMGATYKVRDGLIVSASLVDLGFISWSDANRAISGDTYTFDGFNNPIYAGGHKVKEDQEGNEDSSKNNMIGDQFDALGNDLEKMFSFYDQGKKSKTVALAATLNLGAEYEMPFYDKLSAGFLFTSRIQGKYSWHQGMLSANVRPRDWFEGCLNTSVSSTGWSVGGMVSFSARRFNFFLASDHFIGRVSKEFIPLNNMNANVALGFSIPFN